MEEEISQDCPLCGTPAVYISTDHGKRKYYTCDICTTFQVSNNAEEILNNNPANWREAMSERAKSATEGKALLITRREGGALKSVYFPTDELLD